MKTERFQFVNNKKFNPKSLFRNGEQGVWYDPSDINRYMSNLGPELVSNGNFSNGTTSWSVPAGWSVSGGQVNALTTNASLTSLSSVQIGKTYRVQFSITTYTSGTLYVRIGQGAAQTFTSSGVKVVYLTSVSTTGVEFYGGAISCSIDDISVCEVLNISTATMFQDSAGTIPVTGAEQPVGLMLDKSRGLTRGIELVTNGDFNNGTTGWSVGAWVIGSGVASATSTSSSLRQTGTPLSAGKTYQVVFDYTHVSGTLAVRVGGGTEKTFTSSGRKTAILTASNSNGVEFYGGAVTGSIDNISVRELFGNHAYQTTATARPVLSARVNQFIDSENFAGVWVSSKSAGATVTQNTTIAPNGTLTADTVSFATGGDYLYYGFANYNAIAGKGVTVISHCKTPLQIFVFGGATPAGADVFSAVDIGGGWYKHTLTRTFSVTTATSTLQILPSGSIVGAGSYAIWGADLRPSDQASLPYQRVNTATDYDTVGFPFYLSTDGIDDWMRTNNIDFTNTDKITGFIGARLLVGTGMQMLLETSTSYASNNGAFQLSLNEGNNGRLIPSYKAVAGTQYIVSSLATIPRSIVGTFTFNTALTSTSGGITMRENGTNTTAISVGSSTGTIFGNFPLFLFRRGGTSLPFNGNFYGLILRGALCTTKQIIETEKILSKKI